MRLTLKDRVSVSVLSIPAKQARRLNYLVTKIKSHFKNIGQELLVELNLEEEPRLHTASGELWAGESVLRALFVRRAG